MKLIKLSQFAKNISVTYRTALRWRDSGKLKVFKSKSGSLFVTEDECKEFMRGNENA